MTMGTMESSSRHKSTQPLHTSHMASPHPTATTALQGSKHAAASGTPSYDAGAYGYQQAPQAAQQHTQHAQHAQQAYQQPSVPSWQQLQADNGQAYYYNASTGVTQWERPAGFA